MARNYKPHPINKKPKQHVVVFSDPEDYESGTRKLSVKIDTLWFLLSQGLIGNHEYFAGRYLQGVYLSAQIQPPRCLLGKGPGQSAIGQGARSDREYPDDYAFWCLKQLARIRRRLSRRAYQILQKMTCEYYGDDQKMSPAYRTCIEKNRKEIKSAFGELSWAIGYTTENPRDVERNRLEGNRKTFSRESARIYAGGVGSSYQRNAAPMLGYEANFQFGDRAAV